MNLKPILLLVAVEAQNLLQERDNVGVLALYEQARTLMEDPSVRADRGDSIYINYGFVLNDIGVIRLAWALYGKNPPADLSVFLHFRNSSNG